MSLLKLMSERYTCRRYSNEEVKEEDLLKVLEAARVTPTSHNNQPQKIYVVKSEEAKEKLMKDFAYNYKAPCYLVCTYDINETWRNDLDGNKESGDIDVAIVMTHMMLMAEELGLGACWIGRLTPELVRKNLSIPETEKVVAVLSLGYHREDDRPSKLHDIRRSNEEMVKFL
ncbi:MAG: nitroreductase family protein [Fusobacterium gastrosuis]|uniref:nitroreductase family protein n=2 Tax=Fusobacterium TaxID=848 RepID=UPI002A8DD624|nr:nitroreductase family protein [Fusobacterium gastrosuis]